MIASTIAKKFSIAVTGVACICAAAAFSNSPAAHAAIIAVGDSAAWTPGGTNTLSYLGYKMLQVPNDPSVGGGFSPVKQLSAPASTLSFSHTVYKAYVGTDWAKLATSRLTVGSPAYFNPTSSATIFLTGAILALDLFVETNSTLPILFDIAVQAFNGQNQVVQTQTVAGNIGGQYFGFYATEGDTISSISIVAPAKAQGFAIGEMRVASERVPQAPTGSDTGPGRTGSEQVPEPTTILGTLAFGAFVSRSRLKRKQQQKYADSVLN